MPYPKRTALLLAVCMIHGTAHAQSQLDQYIKEGLEKNIVLQEKKISLDKSLIALQNARSLFLPTTWFEGSYTLAKGGRSIDIPVGDLMNPVYRTLNQLTSSNSFPQISNVSEQLLPNNFYDVRIKTTMPLINPDIRYYKTIRYQQTLLQQNEIDIYRRELVKQIKAAYYTYGQASKAITIYENALQLVNQALRTNQSLLNNGKGLPAYVVRAESEVKTVESQLADAKNDQQNAQAYFNFLLNRDLKEPVVVKENELAMPGLAILASMPDSATRREELRSLGLAHDINGNILKIYKSFRSPRLNGFLDLASQARDFKVDNKSFFYFGGLQLQIPIFTGKRNLYKISDAQLDLKAVEAKTIETTQQLQLAAFVSRNNSNTAFSNYTAALKQEEAARGYFKLIDRGYKEGVNNYIEFLDARTQLTNASLYVNVCQFRFLSAVADLERQTASYSFNQ